MLTYAGEAGLKLAVLHATGGRIQFKDYTGTTFYAGYNSGDWPIAQDTGFKTSQVNTVGICVGSGNTAPTKNDYILESIISSGLTGSTNITYEIDNSSIVAKIDIMLTNTSNDSITVSEIGWFGAMYGASSVGSSTSSKKALVIREVLNAPVTISAGDVETIRLSITLS